MDSPGDLIASGRDADSFAYGNGRVLRRSRNGRSMATEAKTREFLRSHGYPAPEMFDISDDGVDLVMERIDGPTMVDAAGSRPGKIRSYGRSLAELHSSLHALAAPAWLADAPFGSGERLLHMDLQPLNVLLSKNGPVVIDWPNAVRGEPAIDAAVTWILMFSGELPTRRAKAAILGVGRTIILHAFLSSLPKDELRRARSEVIE
jgi:aminoglycoside phosphotransferase (APT) family kinase protein